MAAHDSEVDELLDRCPPFPLCSAQPLHRSLDRVAGGVRHLLSDAVSSRSTAATLASVSLTTCSAPTRREGLADLAEGRTTDGAAPLSRPPERPAACGIDPPAMVADANALVYPHIREERNRDAHSAYNATTRRLVGHEGPLACDAHGGRAARESSLRLSVAETSRLRQERRVHFELKVNARPAMPSFGASLGRRAPQASAACAAWSSDSQAM